MPNLFEKRAWPWSTPTASERLAEVWDNIQDTAHDATKDLTKATRKAIDKTIRGSGDVIEGGINFSKGVAESAIKQAPEALARSGRKLALSAWEALRNMNRDPEKMREAMLHHADSIASAAGRPRTNWTKFGDLLGSTGTGTAMRGIGGAGLGYLLGNALGDHGTLGAILGGAAGLAPEVVKYAPQALDAIKGLFSKNASALAAVSTPMYKKADASDMLLSMAALNAASNMQHMGRRSVDVNSIQVPEGALPPEELLLPEVTQEGNRAAIKSFLKNVGIGTLLGGGGGALLGALAGDSGSRGGTAGSGAILGAILGGAGGLASSAWNTPEARIQAMKAKHNELHGIG